MEWEYNTIEMDMETPQQRWDAVLRDMGAHGWQLSGTVPLLGQTTFGIPKTKGARLIFMRPRPQSQRQP
jgi:hypothetical protein